MTDSLLDAGDTVGDKQVGKNKDKITPKPNQSGQLCEEEVSAGVYNRGGFGGVIGE